MADPNSNPSVTLQKTASVSDMTVGSPLRQITKFALPLILGYILPTTPSDCSQFCATPSRDSASATSPCSAA